MEDEEYCARHFIAGGYHPPLRNELIGVFVICKACVGEARDDFALILAQIVAERVKARVKIAELHIDNAEQDKRVIR